MTTTLAPKASARMPALRTANVAQSTAATMNDHRSLANAIEGAAREIDASRLTSVAPVDAGHALQPRTLLALLAFSYARQIYASDEIESFLRADRNFGLLCREQMPDARTLRRFRRENREALLVCLKAGLRFLSAQKVAEGVITRVNETCLGEEARRRIIMAMFTDSMAMDKDHTTDAPMDLCYLFANSASREH
jgi:hypothetical protein